MPASHAGRDDCSACPARGQPIDGVEPGLAYKRVVYQRQWSPISHKIGLALFVVSAKGGAAKRVTAEDIAGGDHAVWSPDGKWIAFRTHADQEPGEGRPSCR